METEKQVPIWFFIGAILTVYGVLIVAAGVYSLFVPPQREVALQYLHADLWWGALMVIVGAFYSLKFFPKRR
jgi:hypothetical protein